jgi:hypothetical protein
MSTGHCRAVTTRTDACLSATLPTTIPMGMARTRTWDSVIKGPGTARLNYGTAWGLY